MVGMGITGPVDYAGLARHSVDGFIQALTDAAAAAYRQGGQAWRILQFAQGPAGYLFDVGGHGVPGGEDRTVLAWAELVRPSHPRDAAYQRGYPIPTSCAGRELDRGHFIPYSGGGEFGPNLFPQDRALNRGWSPEGRDFRRMEAKAAAHPGTLYFVRPRYVDATHFPAVIDVGLLDATGLTVATFHNRYDPATLSHFALPEEGLLRLILGGASTQEIGDLGEETCAGWLEGAHGAIIVALGGAGMPRQKGRQDLDIVAICGEALVAFEVKARHRSALAGRLTRAGNLPAPRLRRSIAGSRPRQGSQDYVAARLRGMVEVDAADYQGVESRGVVVDFDAFVIQQFQMDDAGRRVRPLGSPEPCQDFALEAFSRIRRHRAAPDQA
jgi:hypothetical protein